MIRTALYLFCSLLLITAAFTDLPAQVDTTMAPFQKRRLYLVGGASIAGYGGTIVILSQAWYSKEDRTGFHTFNDSREWMQVDKVGHAWTAYTAGRINTAMWDWAGLP